MKPLSHPAGPPHSHEALSGCLLRLSLWRQPTQFGCSFPRRELPATCLLSLHSQRPHSPQAPRREKGARYMKVCRDVVGSATLKLSARSVCAGRRGLSWRFYLFTSFFFFLFSGRSHSSQIKMWFRGFDSWMVSICIHLSGFSLNVSENTAEQR